MFGINLKYSLAIVAVAAAVLAAAGSASARTHRSGILYNGHAGLGASAHQHNQTDLEFRAFSPQRPCSEGGSLGSSGEPAAGVTDGTSNTIMFAALRSFSIDIGTSESIATCSADHAARGPGGA